MTAPHVAALSLAVLAVSTTASAAAPAYHVVDRIAGPDARWDYVRVDGANNRLLVAQGKSVTGVELANKTVTPGLAPGLALHDAMPVNGHEMLVTDGGRGVATFADEVSGATLATVKAGKNPDAAAFDARSGLILVMNHSGGDITLIDAKSHQAVGTIEVGGDLEAATVDGAGRAFVNVEDKNQIAVVDVAGRKVVARYALSGCDGPTGIAYDGADRMLITACDGDTAFVDARTGKVLQTLPTGKGADGVAFDTRRKLAFVPAGRAGTMAVIAVNRGKSAIVQTVQTEVGARTIGLDERTGRLYLPAARFVPAATAGARPTIAPGGFHLLVVSP
jgi:DNA-binding beta-propeller fold protein YncE